MKVRVIAQRLNVRKSAKKDSKVLRIVERDEILEAHHQRTDGCVLKALAM